MAKPLILRGFHTGSCTSAQNTARPAVFLRRLIAPLGSVAKASVLSWDTTRTAQASRFLAPKAAAVVAACGLNRFVKDWLGAAIPD